MSVINRSGLVRTAFDCIQVVVCNVCVVMIVLWKATESWNTAQTILIIHFDLVGVCEFHVVHRRRRENQNLWAHMRLRLIVLTLFGVTIIYYRATETNEHTISILLTFAAGSFSMFRARDAYCNVFNERSANLHRMAHVNNINMTYLIYVVHLSKREYIRT